MPPPDRPKLQQPPAPDEPLPNPRVLAARSLLDGTAKMMSKSIFAAIAVLLALSSSDAGASSEIPAYPMDAEFCKAVAADMSEADCMREERDSLIELARRWHRFPPRKRAKCIRDGQTAMMGASYSNLLWCVKR